MARSSDRIVSPDKSRHRNSHPALVRTRDVRRYLRFGGEVDPLGVEPSPTGCKPVVIPPRPWAHDRRAGFRPRGLLLVMQVLFQTELRDEIVLERIERTSMRLSGARQPPASLSTRRSRSESNGRPAR